MPVTSTSRDAYADAARVGKLTSHRSRIIAFYQRNQGMAFTRRAVGEALHLPINVVTGAVAYIVEDEEKKDGLTPEREGKRARALLRVAFRDADPVTGARRVEYLEAILPAPVQRAFAFPEVLHAKR